MKIGDLVKFRWNGYDGIQPDAVGFVVSIKKDHAIILWTDYWDQSFEQLEYLEVVSAS